MKHILRFFLTLNRKIKNFFRLIKSLTQLSVCFKKLIKISQNQIIHYTYFVFIFLNSKEPT